MNSNTLEVNGGMNIKPSARKSIHSNCNTCNINCLKNMVRYGHKVHKKQEESANASQEQGVDEVDNVMSKMARQTSPIPMRRNNDVKYQRNSFGINNDDSSDESDNENVLSKSSPATFSYSSEDLYTSALQNELQRSRNESNHSINNMSPHRSHNISSENQHKRYLTSLEQNAKSIRDTSDQIVIAMIIFLLAVIMFLYSQYVTDKALTNNVYDKFRFDSDVKDLKEKYKVKENSILQVKTGVATIFENQDTASFIFVYNSESINFNPKRFDNFIEDIAATTSRYLRNESKEVHVTVDTTKLMMQTTKDFMNQYQDKVMRTGVMLVKDIDSVPSQLAMAFHYYCDEYNPLVKRSAIFFTFNLANCSIISDKKSSHEYVEKCLANKWNSVGEEKIGPLLTRVVNIVVDVTQTF
ncbi:uncharacterized protein LOC125073973 isoform X2 [Vanessa atalanta]|uniref:uncharacterized protein LOC125073973 isoform X2 n=1 Tax=Vanessa atalanta TaxID=42275 RepID=UPI001FCE1CDD|nr:uncharacterized protein LOC125073973 isoform X2 [Vanessa atalanta]